MRKSSLCIGSFIMLITYVCMHLYINLSLPCIGSNSYFFLLPSAPWGPGPQQSCKINCRVNMRKDHLQCLWVLKTNIPLHTIAQLYAITYAPQESLCSQGDLQESISTGSKSTNLLGARHSCFGMGGPRLHARCDNGTTESHFWLLLTAFPGLIPELGG